MGDKKVKILAIYYDEDDEHKLLEFLKEPLATINADLGEVTNPYNGTPRWISDQIQELCARNETKDR